MSPHSADPGDHSSLLRLRMGRGQSARIQSMSDADDHRWNLRERKDGYLPECEEAFERKFVEWQACDWPDWLAKHLTFPFSDRCAELHFGAVDATLDWRVSATGNRVDFAFDGFDEGDEVSGETWAEVDGGKLTGRIALGLGDGSGFVAQKTAEG